MELSILKPSCGGFELGEIEMIFNDLMNKAKGQLRETDSLMKKTQETRAAVAESEQRMNDLIRHGFASTAFSAKESTDE